MIEDELIEILNMQKEKTRKFNIIYVCVLYEIYIFNMEKNKIDIIEMNKEDFIEISRKTSEEMKEV